LRLTFEDGMVGDVDFGSREWDGVFEPLRDPAYFAQVRVDPELGTIAWPNGADMAPETLYEAARGSGASSAQGDLASANSSSSGARGRCAARSGCPSLA